MALTGDRLDNRWVNLDLSKQPSIEEMRGTITAIVKKYTEQFQASRDSSELDNNLFKDEEMQTQHFDMRQTVSSVKPRLFIMGVQNLD